MLRKMKEELVKEKSLNATLQANRNLPTEGAEVVSPSQLLQPKLIIEDVKRRLEEALRAKADVESQNQILLAEIDKLKNGVPSRGDDSTSRAESAERKLAEAEELHKVKVEQMEHDYQTAVHYVKYVRLLSTYWP